MNTVYRTWDWPADAARLAERLVADLPALELDFIPISLERLEAELLRRFSDPAQLTAPEARTWYEGASAYFGEVMVRGWGKWGWSTEWDDTDPPEVMPPEETDLEPLSPWEAVLRAVSSRTGDELITVWCRWDDAMMDWVAESVEDADWEPYQDAD
ncbi:hypothetical protein [Nocardia arthritidis]|uniref:Uncharacterized protein n=1 Tax=Nocardia arthritidis TaxID=228602 RepID=A0A6G9YMK8_9NOCA|nr:hypothetical protein [Nocardia arthritidis]QIS14307.1 hypothetical protein F5544_32345 [Nocardia arthritidis]